MDDRNHPWLCIGRIYKANYPLIKIYPQNSDLEALEAVSFDRADATVVNLAIASNLITEHGITNLRIAGDSGKNNPLSIAVRSDDPVLQRIMDKGLKSISDRAEESHLQKMDRIGKFWIYDSKPVINIYFLGIGSI